MQNKIIDLVSFLRSAGLSISPGETVDFARALQLVGIQRSDVITAAMSTLAKDKRSRELIPPLINQYFSQRLIAQSAHGKIIPPPVDTRYVLANPPRMFHQEFAKHIEQIKNDIRTDIMLYSHTPMPPLGGTAAGATGKAALRTPDAAGRNPSPGLRAAACSEKAAVRYPEGIPTAPNLRDIDISRAEEWQLQEIKKILKSLARRLASRKGHRKKPAPEGDIDMRRTAKHAFSRAGIPLVLKKHKRRPSKPQVVLLCDLSGSVAPYSEFFLQLLISMQGMFSSLQSFAFVDHVEEITSLAKRPGSWHITAREILRQAKISISGFSDYGRVWNYFCTNYIDSLTGQTTLVILGDAKNNWKDEGIEYFRSIADRCRRIIWLNPLPRDNWEAEDCIIDAYAPFCTAVFECRNARQLAAAIKMIM